MKLDIGKIDFDKHFVMRPFFYLQPRIILLNFNFFTLLQKLVATTNYE